MKLLYFCLLFLITGYPALSMQDALTLESLPDLIQLISIQPCIPITPSQDRIMADLPLMEVSVQSRKKKMNYRDDSDSDSEISVTKKRASTRLYCNLCTKTFARKDILKRHVSRQHGEPKQIMCTIGECTKTYRNQYSLEQHIENFHKLHPKTLKRPRKKIDKSSKEYRTNRYQSQAMLNAKRMPTREQSS